MTTPDHVSNSSNPRSATRRRFLQTIALTAGLAPLGALRGAEPLKKSKPGTKTSPSPFVTAPDGTRLAITDWGEGRPVVFIHGWSQAAAIWDYQGAFLSGQGVRFIALDQRGSGASDKPACGYDFDTLADDFAAVMEQLDLRDAVVVGHSMGCGVAARYLSRHGDRRVGRLMLVSTLTPCLLKAEGNPDGFDPPVIDAVIAKIVQDRPHYYTSSARPRFFGPGLPEHPISDELVQWAVAASLQTSMQAAIETTRSFFRADFREELKAVRIPTTIIHGVDDQSAPFVMTGKKTAQLMAGSELKLYQTGHGLFLTERERFNTDILAVARS